MKTYILNGVSIEVDETLQYTDFYVCEGGPVLQSVTWDRLLQGLERGRYKWEGEIVQFVRELSRWVNEAPRKRHYRNLRLGGHWVHSTEFFFEDQPNGEEIIQSLENSGHLAAKVCRAYGAEPMRPLDHPNPFLPIKGPLEPWET